MDGRSHLLNIDLNCEPAAMSISEFLSDLSMMDDGSEKAMKLEDLIHSLEGECKRIGASQLEVPCCMLLLSKAIARFKEEKMLCEVRAATKESMPCMNISDEGARAEGMPNNNADKDWLNSSKRRSTNAHFDNRQVINIESDDEGEVGNGTVDSFQVHQNSNGGTIHMNLDQNRSDPSVHGGSSLPKAPMISQEPPTKRRRIWSRDLHWKFVNAVETLGGPMAATPKKIWKCMQVPDLTEGEIKSHLQKFRVHLGCFARGRSPLTPSPNTSAGSMMKMSEMLIQSGTQQMPFSIGESSNGQMAAAANKANGGWKFFSKP